MTDEQFYYKSRKRAIGPFKKQLWNMPDELRDEIGQAWEDQFSTLFDLLSLKGTRQYVEQTIKPVIIKPRAKITWVRSKAKTYPIWQINSRAIKISAAY